MRFPLRPAASFAFAIASLAAARPALAAFEPGDLLAAVEFVQQGGPGSVYRVNDGGNLVAAPPDFEMPIDEPIIDICSTDDGRVLVTTSTHRTIYDITSGEPVVFATLATDDASALFCGRGKVFVTSLLLSTKLFDITGGGEVAEPYASGVGRAPLIDPQGRLWAAQIDGNLGPFGGVYRGITKGATLVLEDAWFLRTDIFAATVHQGRVFGAAFIGDGIMDMTDGGDPEFAHAVLPLVRGLTSNAGVLWATTVDGSVFDVTASLDYTNGTPFARLPGPSLSIAVVQKCGDGVVHGREECDGGDGCRDDCTIPRCGDGIVDEALGEECDDTNVFSGDGCSFECRRETSAGPGGGQAPATSSSAGGGDGGGGDGGGANGPGGPGESSGCSASGSAPFRAWPLTALGAIALAVRGWRRRRRLLACST
jgi:cysteine-rich repeat protein